MITISNSKLKLWRRCHLAFHYKYGLKLQRKKVSRSLVFGRLLHSMLENYANGDDPEDALEEAQVEYKKLFREEREEYGNMIEDARIIFNGYLNHWKNDPIKYLKIKGVSAEHEFNIEIAKGIILTGKIDQIGKTRDKRMWLVEDKTFNQLPTDGFRLRDLQTGLYVSAINREGIAELDGVLWNYITNKPMAKPEPLKNGELSRAKNIRTLPSIYRQAIKDAELKVSDYKEVLVDLERKTNDFYKRIFVPIDEDICDKLLDEAVVTAKEILERSPVDRTRNLSKDCDWCEFNEICRAELTGMDTDFIIRRQYVKREKKPAAEEPKVVSKKSARNSRLRRR